jgi:hypothetical protein
MFQPSEGTTLHMCRYAFVLCLEVGTDLTTNDSQDGAHFVVAEVKCRSYFVRLCGVARFQHKTHC